MPQALLSAPTPARKSPARLECARRSGFLSQLAQSTGAGLKRAGRCGGPAALLAILLLALAAAPAFAQPRRTKKQVRPEQLTIVNAQFLDSEDGYPLPAGSAFYPGEQVYIVFNLDGFHITEYEYQMKVSYKIDFLGEQGAAFANSEAGTIAEEVYPQDKNWMPIVRASPRIPFHAEAGTYKIVLYAHDELKPQDEARQELDFEVQGKEIGAADKLVVRNFAFQQSEGGEPLESPSYQPGGTLWGSFYITGFELNQSNAFEVDSRLQVIDPKGEVLFSFTPQEDEGQSFYPRRWLPGRFRVDLDKDIPKGAYTLVLLVSDKLGKQESQTRYPFEIR
jgi:hypothetical protein